MSGDVHVQFCERPGVRFPRATHLVVGCQRKADAGQFLRDLKERLGQFALDLHPDKTRLIEFGRFATAHRRARGERRPETFDFLGFTHYCRKTRNGGFGLGRKPIAKRVTRTLKRLKERLRVRLHEDVHETAQWLGKVVNGWLNYYAVPTSSRTLGGFVRRLEWIWLATLRRRSQRTRTTIAQVTRLTALYWPPARVRHPWSRKDRKTSNKAWQSPQDRDAKIAKMKDGRTHLAHKAEHGVDLETGAILSVTVQDASEGDSATLPETLTMAAEQVEAVRPDGAEVEEVVADKGYHSDATLVALDEIGVRSYVSEPERGRRCWQDKKTGETPAEKRAAQKALYGNRRRIRGDRGRRLQRRRGELVERPFAHQYETGGLRRVWVRGHENVRKRVLGPLTALWGRLTASWDFQWTPAGLVGAIAHRQAAETGRLSE